ISTPIPDLARSRMVSWRSLTVRGSIPEKGSSRRIKEGCNVRDRAISNRRRSPPERDRKSTRLNSSHLVISYAVFCLKKKIKTILLHTDHLTKTFAQHQ